MNISALKRAAEQATPGPWRVPEECNLSNIGLGAVELGDGTRLWTDEGPDPVYFNLADARFIAACDPQTVLKLIKAVEALQEVAECPNLTGLGPRGIARHALQELGL